MCGKRRAFLSLQVGNDGEHYEPALDRMARIFRPFRGGSVPPIMPEANVSTVSPKWFDGKPSLRIAGGSPRTSGGMHVLTRHHSRVARPVKRAAAGASAQRRRRRDAGPTAPGERLQSDFTTCWYQFCICDIVSMLCMSIHGVRMFTEPVFYRGRHGQESEEGKEDREGSHQEGGKEDIKEKEIVVLRDCRLRVATRTQAKPLQKI